MLGFGVTKIPFLNVFLASFVSNLPFENVAGCRCCIAICYLLFHWVPGLYGPPLAHCVVPITTVLTCFRFRYCLTTNDLRSKSTYLLKLNAIQFYTSSGRFQNKIVCLLVGHRVTCRVHCLAVQTNDCSIAPVVSIAKTQSGLRFVIKATMGEDDKVSVWSADELNLGSIRDNGTPSQNMPKSEANVTDANTSSLGILTLAKPPNLTAVTASCVQPEALDCESMAALSGP